MNIHSSIRAWKIPETQGREELDKTEQPALSGIQGIGTKLDIQDKVWENIKQVPALLLINYDRKSKI